MKCRYLSQSHLEHGRQTQVLVEQRNGVLNQDARALVLVRKGPNHDSIDGLMWVLAAVQYYLGVRFSGDGKVGHLRFWCAAQRGLITSKFKVRQRF